MAAPSPAVALRGLAKSYDGGATYALQAATLEIAAGGFVALVGGSGSGKTTLLKSINRLIEPSAGEVWIAGEDARALLPAELRRRIGFVFQESGLFPHMSVGENIGVTPRLMGRPAAETAARVDELLDLVALPRAFAARAPAALSGGQRQRVGIARALAAGPKLMLMDEPFGALDPATREALGQAYGALHDRLGLTTIMVTHDMGEALLLADRVVVLDAGRIVADATPAELVTSPPDHPAVEALLAPPKRQAEKLRALEAGLHG